MRCRLRTLLIVFAIGPMVLAAFIYAYLAVRETSFVAEEIRREFEAETKLQPQPPIKPRATGPLDDLLPQSR